MNFVVNDAGNCCDKYRFYPKENITFVVQIFFYIYIYIEGNKGPEYESALHKTLHLIYILQIIDCNLIQNLINFFWINLNLCIV